MGKNGNFSLAPGGQAVVTRREHSVSWLVTAWHRVTSSHQPLLHIAVFTHSWQRRGHSPLVIKLSVHSAHILGHGETQHWKIIQLWENPSSIKLQSLWRAMNNFKFRKLALNNLYFFSLTLILMKKSVWIVDYWMEWPGPELSTVSHSDEEMWSVLYHQY